MPAFPRLDEYQIQEAKALRAFRRPAEPARSSNRSTRAAIFNRHPLGVMSRYVEAFSLRGVTGRIMACTARGASSRDLNLLTGEAVFRARRCRRTGESSSSSVDRPREVVARNPGLG